MTIATLGGGGGSVQRATIKNRLNKFIEKRKKRKNLYTLHVFTERVQLPEQQTDLILYYVPGQRCWGHYLRGSTGNYQMILYKQGVAQTATKARSQIQAV